MNHIIRIVFLSLYANLIVVDLNTSVVNNTNNVLLMDLLQLHEKFCGNASLDNSSIFQLESDEEMYPMPCCIPCSCDPDMTKLRGCCPVRKLQNQNVPEKKTTGSAPESILNDDNVIPGYLEKDSDVSQVTKDSSVSQVTKENEIWQMTRENNVTGSVPDAIPNDNGVTPEYLEKGSNASQATEDNILSQVTKDNSVSQVTKDTSVSQVTEENDVSQVTKENEVWQVTRKNNVSQVIKEHDVSQMTEMNPETVCIRPQAFYNPNEYLNSIAYEMVASCPVSFVSGSIKNKCQAGFESATITDIIPVTSSVTGITYVNKHCLQCNELREADEHSAHFWQPVFVFKRWMYDHTFYRNQNLILSDFRFKNNYGTNIQFMPSIPNLTPVCHAFDIGTCNVTGLWQAYDEHIKLLCESALSLVVIHKVNSSRKMFKNIACLRCNTDGNSLDKDCEYYGWNENIPVYRMSVNKRSLLQNSARDTQDEITDVYMNETTLIYMTSPMCPAGYLDVMNFCRPVLCPRDHIMNDGHCRPLYDILSGLNLYFKLQVTIDQSVTEDFRQELAETLYPVVNYTLKRTISLQILENSLWFLPGSRNHPVEYYLFNVYLCNSSSGIKYGQAIKEIYTFLQTMKSTPYMRLKNGKIVALTYQFGHQVYTENKNNILIDVSKGRLYPMMVKEWRPKWHGSSMTISNSNWCYRTILTKQEWRNNGVAFNIFDFDIVLYQDQIDDYYVNTIAVCVDVVTDSGGSRKERPNVAVNSISVFVENDDHYNEMPWYLTRDFAVTVFVFGTILFFISFCKVKYFYAKHREQSTINKNQTDLPDVN